jgi:hypothetical protein
MQNKDILERLGAQPEAAAPALSAFEKEIGEAFPEGARELFAQVQSGRLMDVVFARGDWTIDLINFYAFSGDEDMNLSKLWQCRETDLPPLPNGFLPFADNGGGDIFCIGYKGERRGRIFLLDHEVAPYDEDWDGEITEETQRDWGYTLHVADHWRDFLDGLRAAP